MSWTRLLPTYLRFVFVFVSAGSAAARHTPFSRPVPVAFSRQLLRSLDISRLPDVRKMNISQDEYETKYEEYHTRLRETRSPHSHHFTFHSIRHSDESRRISVDFIWAKNLTKDISLSSKLRVFVEGNNEAELEISRTGRPVQRKRLEYLPRWIDIDAGRSEWWDYRLNCKGCVMSRPAVVVHGKKQEYRSRRNSESIGPTDCRNDIDLQGRKSKCCRHQMQVVFSELRGYEFILQPYNFDAGYCKGGCPYRHNHASNHASLLMLMRKLKKGDSPKPCCAPVKLEALQILHVDENDTTKLKVSTLSDMKVTECACS